ncbi:hypothetical protein NKG94_11535 [Micromonospora sp. M12]
MQVSLATNAGRADRPNEDFVGAVPRAAVLLDGAGIPGAESLCSHGVAWYTHRLGGTLLGHLSRNDGRNLRQILATAIGEIAAERGDTCDIADVSSPQATVAMVRARRGRLDWLLLADSFLVLDQAHTGPRWSPTSASGSPGATARHPWTASRGERRSTTAYAPPASPRSVPAGTSPAATGSPGRPRAAQEAVTGGRPLTELNGVVLLSNGASRIVDPYGLTDWPGVLDLLRVSGPAGVIARVRQAEAQTGGSPDGQLPDDATVAYCPAANRPDPLAFLDVGVLGRRDTPTSRKPSGSCLARRSRARPDSGCTLVVDSSGAVVHEPRVTGGQGNGHLPLT